jgi:NNP family nitrate/nitrite transporter-like MFS transporter
LQPLLVGPRVQKYKTYALKIDPSKNDKATEIKLCNFSRPHMSAFHYSWWAFFTAFFIWFAIAPLLSEVKDTLKLSKEDVSMPSNRCVITRAL